jgi:hypothetical protein
MSQKIDLGKNGWELHPGPECDSCQPHPGLRNRLSARLFLKLLTKDAVVAAAIRRLLASGGLPWAHTRITADDLNHYAADLLSRGVWHVHPPVLCKGDGARSNESDSEEEDEAEIVQGPAVRNERAARPQPVPEEGSLPRSADEAAIADAMKLASQLGVPFCEECAKAAMKRAQEAAVA